MRERFGGIDTPAALVGTMTALGVIVFLSALIAAGAATVALQIDLIDVDGAYGEPEAAGYLAALAVVFVAFLVGGWAAGRMARYDGGVNGVAAAFWMLFLVVGFAAAGLFIGEEYNAFAAADLPDWMSQVASDDATAIGIAAAVVAIAMMFLGGWIGGRLGETYHHRVDAALAQAAVETDPVRPGSLHATAVPAEGPPSDGVSTETGILTDTTPVDATAADRISDPTDTTLHRDDEVLDRDVVDDEFQDDDLDAGLDRREGADRSPF